MRPNLEVKDEFGYTVMHYACMGGNKANFDLLAELPEELGLEVDAVSNGGVTCLMSAIKSRSAETVSAVLEQSANPFFKDCLGKDALAYAAEMNDQIQGELIRQITTSMEQWKSQVDESELFAD